MRHPRTRRRPSFTLVELIVVIAVLLLLMAIVLPSFLGVRGSAQDRAAQSAITVAYHDAKASWAETAAYPALATTDGLLSQLGSAEPGFSFITGTPAVPAKDVSVDLEDDQTITLCAKSASGLFFCLRANEEGAELASAAAGGPGFQLAEASNIHRTVATNLELAKCLLPDLPSASPEDCSSLPGEGSAGWKASSVNTSQASGGDDEEPGVSAPTLSWVSTPTSSRVTTATAAFSATGEGVSVTCALDAAPFSCSGLSAITGLSVGSHTIAVAASNAGGSATPLSATWQVYATPEVSFTDGPAASSSTYATGADFTFDAVGDSVECKLDGGSFAPCASPKSLSGLGLGSHTFTVQAGSPGGAPATASRTWSVVAPPTVSITSGPAAGSASALDTQTFAFSATNATSTTCSVDSSAATACAGSYTTAILSPGSHTFQVNAVGPLETASATRSWTVERTYAQEVAASGATHYFRLNETSCAGTMADSIGSASGTYYGAYAGANTLTCGASSSGPLSGVSGSANRFLSKTSGGTSTGGAKNSAGSTGYGLNFSGSSSWATTTGSVEVWFKTTDTSAGSHFLYDKYGDTAAFFDSGTLNVYSYKGVPPVVGASHTIAGLADGGWHHLVVATSGSSIKVYVDGALRVDATDNAGANTTKDFTFGHRGVGGGGDDQGYYFSGSLDEVAFYPTQLSLTAAQAHYAARAR